jgi:hypothetical protein
MGERREEDENMKGVMERKPCSMYNNVYRKRIRVRPWGFCPVERQALIEVTRSKSVCTSFE